MPNLKICILYEDFMLLGHIVIGEKTAGSRENSISCRIALQR